MHSSLKDHPSVSSVKSPVAPIVSKLSSTTLIVKSPRTIFKLDRLWALYRDKDGMPRTYAEVKRIMLKPNFQLHVALLEPCLQEDTTEC